MSLTSIVVNRNVPYVCVLPTFCFIQLINEKGKSHAMGHVEDRIRGELKRHGKSSAQTLLIIASRKLGL
jgi:hypothetical protein